MKLENYINRLKPRKRPYRSKNIIEINQLDYWYNFENIKDSIRFKVITKYAPYYIFGDYACDWIELSNLDCQIEQSFIEKENCYAHKEKSLDIIYGNQRLATDFVKRLLDLAKYETESFNSIVRLFSAGNENIQLGFMLLKGVLNLEYDEQQQAILVNSLGFLFKNGLGKFKSYKQKVSFANVVLSKNIAQHDLTKKILTINYFRRKKHHDKLKYIQEYLDIVGFGEGIQTIRNKIKDEIKHQMEFVKNKHFEKIEMQNSPAYRVFNKSGLIPTII
jgi:hypothetical protein